jgi:hypothetical protein
MFRACAFNRAAFGKVLDQRVKHRVIARPLVAWR